MNVYEQKLVVLGSGGVGKSALTIRLITDNYLEEYDPTIEDSYRKQVKVDGMHVLLDILDTAGQMEFSAMQDTWMRTGKGFMLVYNITSQASFDEVQNLYDKVLRTKDAESVPLVLVGNKCDLEDERVVSFQDGKDLARKWGAPFYEASARKRINTDVVFYELVREVKKFEDAQKKTPKKKKKRFRLKVPTCTIL